jgi:hypothetical protein
MIIPNYPNYFNLIEEILIHASHPVFGGNVGLVLVRDDFIVLRDVRGAP